MCALTDTSADLCRCPRFFFIFKKIQFGRIYVSLPPEVTLLAQCSLLLSGHTPAIGDPDLGPTLAKLELRLLRSIEVSALAQEWGSLLPRCRLLASAASGQGNALQEVMAQWVESPEYGEEAVLRVLRVFQVMLQVGEKGGGALLVAVGEGLLSPLVEPFCRCMRFVLKPLGFFIPTLPP